MSQELIKHTDGDNQERRSLEKALEETQVFSVFFLFNSQEHT